MKSHLPIPGFWGTPTSTVDWCEKNYEHTKYICEFFNTVSSVAMVLVGVVGFLLHRKTVERRFLLAFAIVSLVGTGSIAFHATLRFELQMLDELPMLYSAIVMVYILLENRPTKRFGVWFPAVLTGWAVLVTCLSALTRGNLQFYLFQCSFGSLEFFALYRVYRIYKNTDDPAVRKLFKTGMSLYWLAIVLWFMDVKYCGVLSLLPSYGIPNPQLHAWWHVLVSCGLYLLVLLIAYDRVRTLGYAPEIRHKGNAIPYLLLNAAANPLRER